MCNKYIIIIFLLTMISVTNSRRSNGLNIDNELDQTISDSVSLKEKREIGDNFLNMLELPERPKIIVRKAALAKRSGLKFLKNIYKNVLSKKEDKSFFDEYEDTEASNRSGYDINIIGRSDFIMTIGANNPHSGNRSKTNRGKRIWFDVSKIPRGQNIVSAELRLYQSLRDLSDYNEIYTVSVHRVAEMENGTRVKHYIDSANTKTDKEGWITLNIKQALEYWVNHPRENQGFFVAVHDVDYDTDHSLRPDDIGIVGLSGVPEKQPFIVGFFRNSKKRSKHGTSQREKRDSLEKLSFTGLNTKNIPNNDSTKGSSCNMKPLYINFKELQWNDWIIVPEGYDASYCSGECNFPLTDHMNASHHAIVQTLMHLRKPHEVPKPCCTPAKLSPISVLYFLDDYSVVLKNFENMMVNSCGCH